jgi:HK97 family phage prohead protease/HK97 family phage major capsid protein
MEKIFNLTSTFKALDEDDGGVHICGMASTADFDRAGDTISAEAWTKGGLSNFEKNPIILFNHDYNKPIGRATGLKVTENGLELKAKISKSAPDHVAQLVKEGILGAFSVGFRVKDADYITETDGLKIKDAELFEVSVVSVPCNQAATFSLAKSFNSIEEYDEFKKTFTNRVDLAGQSLAKDENSSVASETPDEAEKSAKEEINMSEVNTPEIDLEAFAKKVAEETAAKIAMKQAETKAVEEKAAQDAEVKAAQEAAEKAAQEEEVKTAVSVGVESGAERLMADIEAKLAEKDAKIDEVVMSFKEQLAEKNEEITKMRESKRVFAADRSEGDNISKWGKEFMYAHMLGVMTGKGMETSYGRDLIEKAGVTYSSSAPNIATEVSGQIEKEIMRELRLARAFREIQINSQAQVLPIQQDTGLATWQSGAATSGNLQTRGGAAPQPAQVILKAYRLISTTLMDNHVDEEVLINLMPMLVESVARSHARAVDSALLNHTTSGSANDFDGLIATAGTNIFDTSVSAANLSGTAVDAADFLSARKLMGKYGMMPDELVYVVSQARYYDLIADTGFADITDVGSDVATKLTGQVGAIYGTPVIVSDNFPAEADNACVGLAVNVRNFAIPRLRGVNVEQDYEVMNQRNVIVATQSLGFNQLVADTSTDVSVVRLNAVA